MATSVRGAAVVLVGILLAGTVFATAVLAMLVDDGLLSATAPICDPVAVVDGAAIGLDDEQVANVAAILSAGAQLGVPTRAAVIAVATALQESTLRNLAGGDRDSAGLFQQRPSQGWGTLAQITDPVTSATAFYRRLLTVRGWDQLPLTEAAQLVQRSAFPDAYAKWEPLAAAAVNAINGECASSASGLGIALPLVTEA